jgi:Thioredoxin-like
VLGISLDRDKQKWIDAIAADGLAWTQLSDLKFWSNSVAQQFGIQSIPQNFLIDPQGNLIAKNLRGAALEYKLMQVIK